MQAAERYRNLDFDRLLEQLSGYAGSELTQQLIRNINVEFHRSRIDENLEQTSEALRFIDEKPSVEVPPFSLLEDLTGLWQQLSAGELIDSTQAQSIIKFLTICESFDGFLKHVELSSFPRLADVFTAWQSLSPLYSSTKRVFNEEGNIRDKASRELARIREQLRRFEGDVGHLIRDISRSVKDNTGEEALLTVRNNRFVVLLPRSLSREFKGSIVDVSGSGQHIYFEPAGIGSLNAERQHLFLEEDKEVRRILRDYGRELISYLPVLNANLSILVKCDYIFARARHARALEAKRPQMGENGHLELIEAVHPLLRDDFVPETLRFQEEKALIISGVNAGGKTILLKLVGLYSLMAALGCYVPGEAQLPYISGVYADIGDDQSALANLSTFTAHLRFINDLWEELATHTDTDPPSLVLIDEIGTGTEPGEGAAFAYGLINTLLAYPVKLAVTTHYDLLKTLGFERDDVKNVCLEFDQDKLKPTFRVLDNQPGQSFAFEIARRWEIDSDVLNQAQSVLGKEEQKLAAVIAELEQLNREADQTRRQIKSQSEELYQAQQANARLSAELTRSKQSFAEYAERVKQDLERRIDDLLVETKKKLKKKARQSAKKRDEYVKAASRSAAVVREQKAETEAVVEAIKASLAIKPERASEAVTINIGNKAMIKESRVQGEVLDIDPQRQEAVLSVMGKRVTVALSRLSSVETGDHVEAQTGRFSWLPKSATGSTADPASRLTEASDSIDLHGQTVVEANESLDDFISRCLECNISTIRVLHGVGTGRLKAFVQDYLKHHPQITNVRHASVHEGGVGVSLADLK